MRPVGQFPSPLSGMRWLTCPACGGEYTSLPTGQCVDCDDREAAARAAAHRLTPEYRAEQLERWGVPASYRDPYRDPAALGLPTASREALERATKRVMSWVVDPEPAGLVLYGGVGAGKTFLAIEAAWRLGREGTVWLRAGDVVGIEIGSDDQARDRLRRAKVLVLDDLGRRTGGQAWDILAGAVARRYEERVTTIVTTNLTGDQIPDPSLRDRLRDWLTVRVGGESLRGREVPT